MSRGTKYPIELKERAVRTVVESGRPIAQVAKDLDVGAEALRCWIKRAQADAGARADVATSVELEELRALRSENRELRKNVEILKAASVFFVKELDGTPRR